jgi:hypothetical protein
MKKINPEIIEKLQILIEQKLKESEIRRWFREELCLSKSQGNAVFNEVIKSIKTANKSPEITSEDSKIQFVSDKYSYNELTDSYIIYLKCQSKPLVISGPKHRAICRSYSEWGEGLTTDEICKKYALTPEIFEEYRRIFSLTKQKEPLSIEEVLENSVEDSVGKIIEEKRYKIYQQYEKESWKNIQSAAIKWQKFQAKEFDPFINFIESWTPPEYKPVEFKENKVKRDKYWVASLSDIHVGLISHGRFNYHKGDWSHADLEKSIKDYVNQIREEVTDRKTGFKEAYLLLAGDICHTLTGFTDKGTKLEYQYIAENQFDLAFTVLSAFLNEMLAIFPSIKIKSVAGNHSSFGDYVVAKTLEAYYRSEDRIKFEITTARYLPFKIENSLFILEHGYSPFYKSRLPNGKHQRENYINGLFLSKPELLQGVKTKYYLSADQHHAELKETNFYEQIMFSTIVGADRHSDNCGYVNRPRQNCLVIDNQGLKEIIHFYFD